MISGRQLSGLTVGGGWRWRSANVIGSNSAEAGDHRQGDHRGRFHGGLHVELKAGSDALRVQMNISNLFESHRHHPVALVDVPDHARWVRDSRAAAESPTPLRSRRAARVSFHDDVTRTDFPCSYSHCAAVI